MQKAIYKYFDAKTILWFDLFAEGILVTDEKMVVEYVNPAFLKYAGIKAEQIVGLPLPEARPGSYLPEMMQTKKPIYNRHRQYSSGVESYVDLIPFCENGFVIGAIIVVRDKKLLLELFRRIEEKNEHISRLDQKLKYAFRVNYSFADIIGAEAPFIALAKKAAKNDSSVLLLGESGTGKEVLAQSIHGASGRSKGPFIDVNCAALPEALLESELFGYSSGAFTGASKEGKIGLFELANGGTLFLDEITEMPLALQSKLLRALEERKIRRLGDNRKVSLDVRIIAATNRTIDELDSGSFRSDLFYRLAVFIIKIPPLRERTRDIPLFVRHYLDGYRKRDKRKYSVSEEAMSFLTEYSWPGNVRQLKNAIEYACDVAEDSLIQVEDLPGYVIKERMERKQRTYLAGAGKRLPEVLDEIEKSLLAEALGRYGNGLEARKAMAAELGISIATLYNKLRRHKLLNL